MISDKSWEKYYTGDPANQLSNREFSRNGKTIHCLGRFRKKHAMDCGKPGCFVCHSDKILKIPSKKEILADMRMKEQLKGENDG